MSALNSTYRFIVGSIISGAIFLMTACGSDNPEQASAVKGQVVASQQTSAGDNNQPPFSETDNAWVTVDSTTSNSSSSIPVLSAVEPTPSSANAGVVKGWANDQVNSSSLDSQLPAKSSSVAAPSNKIAILEWEHPTERANGEYLELEDIAGYELRYSRDNEHYESVVIPGSRTTFYEIPSLLNNPKGMKVEIAVFDTNGLYSEFVDISPSIN